MFTFTSRDGAIQKHAVFESSSFARWGGGGGGGKTICLASVMRMFDRKCLMETLFKRMRIIPRGADYLRENDHPGRNNKIKKKKKLFSAARSSRKVSVWEGAWRGHRSAEKDRLLSALCFLTLSTNTTGGGNGRGEIWISPRRPITFLPSM